MLQVIRERAQGWIVWAIVGLIILTFALWGIGEYFREEPPLYVAKVNDEPITQVEYQRALAQERERLQKMLRGADISAFEAQLKKQALERLIDRKLIVQAATEMGLVVPDAQLQAVLESIQAFHNENGRFDRGVYEQRLRSVGLSTTVFENDLRFDLLAEQLVNGVTESAFATARDIDAVFALQEQHRDVGYALFAAASVQDQVQVSEAEIQQYYQTHQEAFQEPEKVKLAYVRLAVQDLLDKVQVSDEEIRQYYESHKDLYTVPEERRVAHILIETGEGADATAAKKKAEEIYRELEKGADFAQLAKKYSQDPGSAAQGGDLGFIERGMMDPEFEDVAFSLPKGEVSRPVRTEFGYHLIKVLDVKPGHTKSLAEVRAEVERELRREKAEKRYLDELERLANQAFEHPDSLEPAAEALGLKVETSDWLTRQGGKGLFAHPKVLEAAFSKDVLEEGYNSEPIEVGKGEAVVVRVAEHRPAQVKPLEAVRGEIEARLRREKAQALLAKKGSEFMDKIREGADPSKVAQAMGATWRRVAELPRSGTEGVPAEVVRAAFRLPRPERRPSMEGVALSSGDYAVVAVFAVHEADPGKMDEETRQRYAQALRQTYGGDEFNALLQALKARAEIERYQDRL